MNLLARVSALEASLADSGPLLFCWELDPQKRATVVLENSRYTQAADEDRAAFLRRVDRLVPRRTVLWIDQLDEKL